MNISRGRAGIALAMTLALAGSSALAVNLIYLPGLPRPRGMFLVTNGWLMTAQGTSAALAILAAAWIVWGTGRLTTRLAVSALWLVIVLLLWQRLFPFRGLLFFKYEQQWLAFGTWLGAIGLCAAAWRFGIRVVDRCGQVLGSDPRLRQISLLGLLALMSGVAAALGVARLFVPREASEWNFTVDDAFRLLAQIGGSLLAASTVITCYHQPRAPWKNLLLTVGFVAAIAVLHMIAWGQSYRMHLFPPDPRVELRGIHYLPLTAWLLLAVGIMSACGLRLRRRLPADLSLTGSFSAPSRPFQA